MTEIVHRCDFGLEANVTTATPEAAAPGGFANGERDE
jgi:hypothetical protein